jgi:alkylation response protein AidB-like acyl-CoA dehydrogenase
MTTKAGAISRADAVLARLGEVLPILGLDAATHERNRVLPYDGIRLLRETGVFLLRVPVEYGGAGGTIRQQMSAIISIASVDSNLAQSIRPHFFFIEELLAHGFGDSVERWWPDLVSGSVVGNALSEAGTGRVGNITSVLRRQPDGTWRLNGTKAYSTGALFADLLFVSGQDEEETKRTALIPSNRPGITLHDDWDGMGQRLTATGTTVFRDVAVFDAEILELKTLEERFTHIGGQRQLFLSAVVAGIAMNASNDLKEYVLQRARPCAHSLAERASQDPFVLRTAGELSSAAFAARAIVLAAAESLDAAAAKPGEESAALAAAMDVARAQSAVADTALPAIVKIFDSGGASAVRDDLNLHRHWRNARTVVAHNPIDYKKWAVGNWEINRTEPPRNSYF